MSYFDFYYNTKGEKTLRSYSLPFNLSVYDYKNWETTDEDLEYIGEKIEKLHHFEVVTPEMIARLNHVSEAVFRAGLLGSNEAGLFKPK